MRHAIGFSAIPAVMALLCTGLVPATAQTIIQESTQAPSTTVERTIVRESVAPARKAKSDRKATPGRKATTRATTTRAAPRGTVRTTTHERIVTTPAPVRERIVAPAPRRIVTDAPLALTEAERAFVYRTIVDRPVQRNVVVTEPARRNVVGTEPARRAPVVNERIVTRAPEPLVTIDDDDDDIVVPPARRRVMTETTGVAVPAERVELVVGARVPRNVPLYDIPASAVAAAPTIGQYRYALIGDRVYLVDPDDGVVVTELYR
jgi:hypothetical protein